MIPPGHGHAEVFVGRGLMPRTRILLERQKVSAEACSQVPMASVRSRPR
jgi:hypothetical protein